MSSDPAYVTVKYEAGQGLLEIADAHLEHPAWVRLNLAVRSMGVECLTDEAKIWLPWADALALLREFGSRESQISYGFRFKPEGEASLRLSKFVAQLKKTRAARASLPQQQTDEEIKERLSALGFTKRYLRDFQMRDLRHLLALPNGANFSVPGAGKTTVTFALHLLTRQAGEHLLVVAPKSAIQAWQDVVTDCISADAPSWVQEPFTVLEGQHSEISNLLSSGASRFVISYDMLLRQQALIASHLSVVPTHLVLDESHRMKAGVNSQRGAYLLRVATLPVRRDILSGTPMPQAASDIESQLDFLWPGHGLGAQISQGGAPKAVLGNLYARTTKAELGLKKPNREFRDVAMAPGQLALYSIVRNEFLREFAKASSKSMGETQFLRARRSVMRLLQLSINPTLALSAMAADGLDVRSAVIDQVLEEQHSAKMRAVIDHARALAASGQKCVIWTIFTGTIESFVSALADLNPVFIHGGVPTGSPLDPSTREGRIRKFHQDSSCSVLVANPAAAGEGISLHTVCHNAIYADRSYVSTHYLQSIDRIHRLGLAPGQETYIYVYRSKAPAEIGSIDLSVSRRLTEKIRNMQVLLDDPDLHEIALDEEEAADPIDYDVELQDIVDLISELEGRTQSESLSPL